ncbi:hypothetical protein AMTRI_Chr08g163790 [Amborella trichopoda]
MIADLKNRWLRSQVSKIKKSESNFVMALYRFRLLDRSPRSPKSKNHKFCDGYLYRFRSLTQGLQDKKFRIKFCDGYLYRTISPLTNPINRASSPILGTHLSSLFLLSLQGASPYTPLRLRFILLWFVSSHILMI